MSKYIATLDLDDSFIENPETNINDHSPIGYVEEELGWASQSGIYLDGLIPVDEDGSTWSKYISYLADWIITHADSHTTGDSPLPYDKWELKVNAGANRINGSMSVDEFINAMDYPYNNRVMAISVSKPKNEFDDHIQVLGYIDGDFDLTVYKPSKCFLDSFCRDHEHSGDVMDYIKMFSSTYATFTGDEEDPADKAITYLRDIYIDSHSVVHRANTCLILRNDDMDELLNLPAGVYLVGIK